MRTNLAQWFLVILLVVGAFAGGAFWRESMSSASATEPCSADARSFQLMNSLLRRFDDAMILAINVSRDQVVDQVEEIQTIRRQVEELPVPACQTPVKTRMVDYMNQVVDLLVAFVGGVQPDLVFRGLSTTSGLRESMEAAMADFTGATVTPFPTSFPLGSLVTEDVSIPVTGTSETPAAQAAVTAIVTSEQGANLRAEPSSDSTLVMSLAPNTQVDVLGVSADQFWVYVTISESVKGWLYVPLITVSAPVETLPVIE